eukprot:CAMPEP_0174757402 /NCGR_PEP_ID=MMETSP1094-20130205/107243_1 /TAXON_ID=156173 /ORGANISM="Chrysochromulina brevifilum, Strain UTEX LB 985" /LENGTH=48 /DNA_ID= /DNA_START= /DNA_END= /DNA_ORIENTATION=
MSDDPGDRRCSDSSLHARNVPNDSGAVFSSRFDVRVGGLGDDRYVPLH